MNLDELIEELTKLKTEHNAGHLEVYTNDYEMGKQEVETCRITRIYKHGLTDLVQVVEID
jgi:hypothetical protein